MSNQQSRTLKIAFTCSECDERLEVKEDQGFFTHGKYHSCFGETVRGVAMINEDRITTTREGINLEVIEDE